MQTLVIPVRSIFLQEYFQYMKMMPTTLPLWLTNYFILNVHSFTSANNNNLDLNKMSEEDRKLYEDLIKQAKDFDQELSDTIAKGEKAFKDINNELMSAKFDKQYEIRVGLLYGDYQKFSSALIENIAATNAGSKPSKISSAEQFISHPRAYRPIDDPLSQKIKGKDIRKSLLLKMQITKHR